ncbi:hypothetical protein N657DRAFT_624402 [Parathielavia appendiculata]|uniref:Get5 N-terminal domain-containing protein n=1 Tax=Parathielavia appendiculata TaxID=2587402 RepID=A0AAN6TU70_9PEZI|nr:hypothetical protein N657DRAFT_624402 [Parathielavia appendiculata]
MDSSTLRLKARLPAEDEIENWDDEDFLIDGDDLAFHSLSNSANIFTNRRDSQSSFRSDFESIHGEEEKQVHLPDNDEKSTLDAIAAAAKAGIPLPQNVPPSALMGGTIKRLGGRKIKKIFQEDWVDDLEFPEGQALQIKPRDSAQFPEVLRQVSNSTQPSPSKPPKEFHALVHEGAKEIKSTPSSSFIDLEKFRDADDDDDFFGNGGTTIKVSKRRETPKPLSLITPPTPQKPVGGNVGTEEDFEADFELPEDGKLKLSAKSDIPKTPTFATLLDDLDWAEGSLGTRFGGTRRDAQSARSSSVSAFSPSIASSVVESEDDTFDGLIIPNGPLDLGERLKRRRRSRSPPRIPQEPILEEPTREESIRQAPAKEEREDFLAGLDIGDGEVFDSRKLTLHRNIQVKATRPASPSRPKASVALKFTNKPITASRLPRPMGPMSGKCIGFLNTFYGHHGPVYTTQEGSWAKGIAGVTLARKAPVPFLPAGASATQSYNINAKSSRIFRRHDSETSIEFRPNSRAVSRSTIRSPSPRPFRSAEKVTPDGAWGKLSMPRRARNFGDGHELDAFDDLPTSTQAEAKFLKQPVTAKSQTRSRGYQNILPDRNVTPSPRTPYTSRVDCVPSFARDTAASRIARETILAQRNPSGVIAPLTAQRVAQLSVRGSSNQPSSSQPTVKAKKVRRSPQSKPHLISNLNPPKDPKLVKGMWYNPETFRWEGNDNALSAFDVPASSPSTTSVPQHAVRERETATPRPALITNIGATKGVQVVGGMVFDPQNMCWLKLAPQTRSERSDTLDGFNAMDDEEDVFKDIPDLEERTMASSDGGNVRVSDVNHEWPVGEEFDVGPEFVRRQREEEERWRKKCHVWINSQVDRGNAWKWAIRDIVSQSLAEQEEHGTVRKSAPQPTAANMATELTFAKTFLSLLDSKPSKISPDHIEDPRSYPGTSPYILPRHPSYKPFSKSTYSSQTTPDTTTGGSSSSSAKKKTPGSERAVKVVLRSPRNPPFEVVLPACALSTSLAEVKERVADQTGIEVDKIKLLHNKKPAGADSKSLKDLLPAPTEASIGEVELGVMILGGAAAVVLKKKEEKQTAGEDGGILGRFEGLLAAAG